MQVKALNRLAQRKYEEFVGALDMVGVAFEQAKKLIATHDPTKAPAGVWSVPSREDLDAALARAQDDLNRLRANAKKYEAELVSREWRV